MIDYDIIDGVIIAGPAFASSSQSLEVLLTKGSVIRTRLEGNEILELFPNGSGNQSILS